MIKRFIACLSICLIITGLISPVYSHAEPIPIYTPNWNDPGIAEIINISDLTGWMANGGVYDITSFQNLDEFLTWYFKIRVPVQDEDGNITFAPTYGYDTYIDSNYTSPRFIEQSNIRGMISRSYQNKTGYGRRLQEQVDKALLENGDLTNVNIPLLNKTEAGYFVGFNPNALTRYKKSFLDSSIQPNPDPDYLNYIHKMNDIQPYGNLFVNLPSVYNWGSPLQLRINPIEHSYLSYYNGSYSSITYSNNGYNFAEVCASSEILDLNIISNGSSYTGTITGITKTPIYYKAAAASDNYYWFTDVDGSSNANYEITISAGRKRTPLNNGSLSYSGTLAEVLNYFSNRVRNINIYVDGVLWAIASEPEVLTPEFPDVVGGDELPTTTWPLTVPKAPSYINLPGLRQAFQRAKNTDNQFDIMDLTDSLVDPDGDPIVDPEMETVPIPLPNPDPINPEVVPELPDLPLIPAVNNPGFSGVSVLAEIINFTNQSLPSALITVFWGIVFGAVILGIIKILHK